MIKKISAILAAIFTLGISGNIVSAAPFISSDKSIEIKLSSDNKYIKIQNNKIDENKNKVPKPPKATKSKKNTKSNKKTPPPPKTHDKNKHDKNNKYEHHDNQKENRNYNKLPIEESTQHRR